MFSYCGKPGENAIYILLKYCGGCNPDIDRAKVIREFCKHLSLSGYFWKIVNDIEKANIGLLVNGCKHACLQNYEENIIKNIPCISIRGKSVDYCECEESDLVQVLFSRVLTLI